MCCCVCFLAADTLLGTGSFGRVSALHRPEGQWETAALHYVHGVLGVEAVHAAARAPRVCVALLLLAAGLKSSACIASYCTHQYLQSSFLLWLRHTCFVWVTHHHHQQVYKGRWHSTDVAIKIVTVRNPDELPRVLHEAEVMMKLDHGNIVHAYHASVWNPSEQMRALKVRRQLLRWQTMCIVLDSKEVV